ncbi:MAG: hypothetical protein KDB66_03170 [Solirubrobacterales bacterium]|nr:hypothetical protein [Solirubrobacterales bacterium]MCB8915263.1 transcriptional regulator [Thermoleophilales bacterium]
MLGIPGSAWHAVDATSDRVGHALALRRLYQSFHEGQPVDSQLRAVVAQSWKRSEQAGLTPEKLPPVVADEDEIAERWQGHPLFPVLPLLRQLLTDATTQSGHMLVITDENGILLWIEGHRRVVEATENMHLVTGADWSEGQAGTNAMGTALAVDHPVQIFSAEHFNKVVHPWQCSGAPIHDPETDEILGAIDLTGHLKTAHPHTLSLVGAAAGMAEVFMQQDLERRVTRIRERHLAGRAGSEQPAAILGRTGKVLSSVPEGWVSGHVDLPAGGSRVTLNEGGEIAELEQLDGDSLVLLWGAGKASPDLPSELMVELLSLSPRLTVGGRSVPLSLRHGELLALLAMNPDGIPAERLAIELYGDRGRPESVRAEISRLRSLAGPIIESRPYRIGTEFRADFLEVEPLIEAGRVGEAMNRYRESLLPLSEVGAVIEAARRIDGRLRAAVIESEDPVLISRWCGTSSGQSDLDAAELLLTLLAEEDARLPGAIAHAERLRRSGSVQVSTTWS